MHSQNRVVFQTCIKIFQIQTAVHVPPEAHCAFMHDTVYILCGLPDV